MSRRKIPNHREGLSHRPGPLGLRRPSSDELVRGPFSLGRRSDRARPGAVPRSKDKRAIKSLAQRNDQVYERTTITGWF
jgi:hypothetical protein